MKRGKAPILNLRPRKARRVEGSSSVAEPLPTVSPAPLQACDRLQFDEVYQDHAEYVWRCVRRLGVPDASAEDIVQEVFLVVHRKLSSFEGRSSVRTWLYGIALLLVRNFRRSRKRKLWEQHDDIEGSVERASEEAGPESQAARAEAIVVLQQLLNRMSDVHREVFVLAELEHCTGEEIAQITGAKLSTTYARLSRARQDFEALAHQHAIESKETP